MFKKLIISLFLCVCITSPLLAEDTLYPVTPPTTEKHLDQIKWSHEHGYVRGILASYGWFLPAPKITENFDLPIIRTAWEVGYIKGVLEVSEDKKQ